MDERRFELGTIAYHFDNIKERKIYLQLIPRTAWNSNLRTLLGNGYWNLISAKVRKDANYTCAYCGEYHPEKYGTEAHEEWEWDLNNGIQKLKAIKCVCKKCHMTVHPGCNQVKGIFTDEEIRDNYAEINGITDEKEVSLDFYAAKNYHILTSCFDWKIEEGLKDKIIEKYLSIVEF